MDYLKILKIIGGIVLLVGLVFLQLSFIDNLPAPINNLNLVFILLFFLVLLLDYRLGLWAGVIVALLLEVYSALFFGGIIFPLIIALILVNFLFKLLFTNRSLFSLMILSFLGMVVYYFLNFIYLRLAFVLDLSAWQINLNSSYLINVMWEIFLVLFCLAIIFVSLRIFSRRFKSVFLVEGRR